MRDPLPVATRVAAGRRCPSCRGADHPRGGRHRRCGNGGTEPPGWEWGAGPSGSTDRGDAIDTATRAGRAGLAYHRTGAGEPLVLLHGMGESTVGWRPVQDVLSARFDVVALDLPGFGRSPALPPSVVPSAEALADAVRSAVDDLDLGEHHVAGYSRGARVALELATRGGVRSVVAIAPDGLGTPAERFHQASALLHRRATAIALAPVATPWTSTAAGRALFFGADRSLPWRMSRADASRLLRDFASSPGYLSTLQASLVDVPQDLRRVTCPVLIVQGTADPLVSMQSPRYLAVLPNASMRWLPGFSHVPISDAPELVAGVMADFLRRAGEPATIRR